MTFQNTALSRATDLSPNRVAVLAKCWEDHSPTSLDGETSSATTVRGLGKFIRMDWKIGVTVGLSTGKNGVERPNQPFITVVLHFADETGSSSGIKSQCFEMSCSQFKDFARSIRSMGAAFENM